MFILVFMSMFVFILMLMLILFHHGFGSGGGFLFHHGFGSGGGFLFHHGFGCGGRCRVVLAACRRHQRQNRYQSDHAPKPPAGILNVFHVRPTSFQVSAGHLTLAQV
ncbi:MAG: hypothetical protein F4Y75_00085 [Acidimicrobiia bacterium]|nr:hypothetical protein [Acidimicrobiia bacterium]